MNIRLMTMEDYDAVYALWSGSAGIGLHGYDDSREGIQVFLRRNPTTCFVAEEDDTVVGSVLIGNDGRRGIIHHMAVSPDYRRRGVAKALLDVGSEALRQEGIRRLNFVAYKSNEEGNAFWQAQGCELREDLNYYCKWVSDIHD